MLGAMKNKLWKSEKLKTKHKIVLIMVFVFCLTVYLSRHFASARIDFSETVVDLGYVPNDSEITKTITIFNHGRKNLVIKSAMAGCGCTKYAISKSVIKPNETASLKITQKTSVKRFGKQSEFLYISSNDSHSPLSVITVQYVIADVNTFDPEIIDIGRVSRGDFPQSYECIFYKNPNFSSDQKISIFTNLPDIAVDYSNQDNELLQIHLQINSSIPTGELYSKLFVTNEGGFSFSTKIIGSVVGNYYSYPKMIDLGEMSSLDSDIFSSVKIISRKECQFQITDTILEGELAQFMSISNIEQIENEWVIFFKTTFENERPVLSKSEMTGRLLLTCKDGELTETVQIPIRMRMRAPRYRPDV